MRADGTSPILLVEDSADDRFLMLESCKRAGIANPIRCFADGDEAIAFLAAGPAAPLPGLMILDLKMPRKSGMDVLAWLRGDERWKKLPVIVLTASMHPGDIEKAYALGVNSFVVKPSSVQELIELAEAIKAYWLRFNLLSDL